MINNSLCNNDNRRRNKMREIINVEGYMCICTDKYVTIVNSNEVPDNDIPRFIKILRRKIDRSKRLKDKYKRTEKSWEKEWLAHNRLYRMGLFKSHTKDVDFHENESIFRLISYEILGINRNTK
jgi:hypothetical protein